MSSGQFGSVASNCTKTLQSCCTWILRSRNSQENLWKLRCLAPKDVRRSLYIYISSQLIRYIVVAVNPIHKPQTAVLNGGRYRGWSLQEVADRHPKRFAFRQCETDSGAILMWSIWCGRWCINYRVMCKTYIYICMCMYICTYVYVYVHMYVCMFIYIYA